MKQIQRVTALLLLCLCLLTACGKKEPPVVAGDAFEEPITLEADLKEPLSSEKTISGEDVSCEVVSTDGKKSGFEMRFHKTPELHNMFSSAENVYFAVLRQDEKTIVVPTELVRILTDIETGEFRITILLPSGEKCKKGEWQVSFYVCSREDNAENAKFEAQKSVLVD